MNMRIEADSIGTLAVPTEAYYGVQSSRAKENFAITGTNLHPELVKSLARIKKAAAVVNAQSGNLTAVKKDAIVQACDEIMAGYFHEAFIVDAIQGGAGTSANMNANEVIANRALEILGYEKGDYQHVHPNNNVNLSQSTNDAYPTAMSVALDEYCVHLLSKMDILYNSLKKKSAELTDQLKMGRTHLQDAVPMTAGQEFNAFATMIKKEMDRIDSTRALFHEINMGGTAIGTGLNAPAGYSEEVAKTLSDLTGRPYYIAEDLIEATQDTSAYVALSGNLRLFAARLSKIAHDLRLQSSGPRAGLAQYRLPEMQPGSSIMPGKVNPVIPEVVNQACFHVMGIDHTIAMASENGQLQLNVFEPVIAFNLFTGMSMLANICEMFATRCIDGLMMNNEACSVEVFNNIGLVTALNPHLGYDASSFVARRAQETGGSVYDIVLEEKLMDKETLDDILSPANMVYPKVRALL